MKYSTLLLSCGIMCVALSAAAQLDPRINYSTYLGGSKSSCTDGGPGGTPCSTPEPATARAKFVAVDASKNIYVAGSTNETDFPITPGAYNSTIDIICFPDQTNCVPNGYFLAKFSSAGHLVFSTFLPSPFSLSGMTADQAGNVYVVGSSTNCTYCFREFHAIMYKFSPTGTLVYTYDFDAVNAPSCGDPQDQALHIALNSAGTAAYLTGIGTNGGTLPDCLSATPGALNSPGNTWVAKLNVSAANSASLTYLAFIASPSTINGIAVDSAGEAFVAGVSDGTNTLISLSTFQPVYGGGSSDAFVTKLNVSGSHIVYSSYLGGIGADRANSIAVDRFGYAVVTGTTTATNFPHTRVYGTDLSSIAFITRFSPDGNKISYSDMVLGPAGNAVATDSAGNAYVGGGTGSKFVPLVIPFQSSLKGTTDAWFGNASSAGILTTSSYLGGSGGESGNAIVVDNLWNTYVVGSTTSSNFPVTANAYKHSLTGSQAAFLTKLIIDADLSVTASPSPNPVAHGANLTYSYAVMNKGPDNSDGDTLTTTIPSGTTFQGFSTTAGTCSHPPLNGTGTFTCSRGSLLLAGHSWGPITLTVKVNAVSGTTVTNTAKVTAKTQDVNSANNTATVSVHVQ